MQNFSEKISRSKVKQDLKGLQQSQHQTLLMVFLIWFCRQTKFGQNTCRDTRDFHGMLKVCNSGVFDHAENVGHVVAEMSECGNETKSRGHLPVHFAVF